MADYNDLPELIGKLKLAAIDAYMREHYFEVLDDHYWRVSPSMPGVMASTVQVERPSESGEGGGLASDGYGPKPSDSYVDDFSAIRARIDAALKGWTDLPDPEDIKAAQFKAEAVCGALPSGNGSGSLGRSKIEGWLSHMGENLDHMSGHVVEDFKTEFLSQLGVVMMGQHDIAVAWAATLAAEKGAFKAARATVVDLVEQVTEACEAVAVDSEAGVQWVPRIADWTVSAVSAFMSEGATTVISLTDLGIKMLQSFATSLSELHRDVSEYETAMEAFEEALDQTNAELKEAEGEVLENLLDNLEAVYSNKSAFDLTIARTANDGVRELKIEQALVDEVTNRYMPQIADELEDIARRIPLVSMKMAVLRDGHIGIGERGPSDPFGEMRILLEELVRDLSWDVKNGAQDLKLAVQAIVDQDAAAQREWDDFGSFLDQGSGIDPWNDEHERDTRERP